MLRKCDKPNLERDLELVFLYVATGPVPVERRIVNYQAVLSRFALSPFRPRQRHAVGAGGRGREK
jgi:hypothetical protein